MLNVCQNVEKGKGIYYESHHILPKCLNGSNKKDNLVLLTAKEHFIAHKLLLEIYPNNRNIFDAYFLMVHMNKQKYNISGREFEKARILSSLIPISEETKEKTKKTKIRRN